MFCNSAAPHATTSLDLCGGDISVNSHWNRLAKKYNRIIDTESVHRPNHYQKDEQKPRKDSMMVNELVLIITRKKKFVAELQPA